MIIEAAILCLALNVYHESRSEAIMGQYAVAQVTMNRAKQNNHLVCAEVFKPKQFSWANTKVTKVKGGWFIPKSLRPKDEDAWNTALKISAVFVTRTLPMDITKGATFYHNNYVRPYWADSRKLTKRIGNHLFYHA